MTNRNEPCPCGSGKKYKKCCGAALSAETSPFSGNFELNRRIAYKGDIGRRRENFCLQYITFKQAAIKEVEADLKREVDKAGLSITCSRGCGECCSAFITATLQECEAIAFHLYQHEDLLQRFLASYTDWRARIDAAPDKFNIARALQRDIMSSPPTEERTAVLREALEAYIRQRISCPFLAEGACSIYEVRPYVCAGVVSTSPPEWCAHIRPEHGRIILSKAETDLDNDLPYFVPPARSITYLCMPEFVHELLQNGYATLSSLPGLERLAREAAADPEVLDKIGRS